MTHNYMCLFVVQNGFKNDMDLQPLPFPLWNNSISLAQKKIKIKK